MRSSVGEGKTHVIKINHMKTILLDGIEVPADEEWDAVRNRQRLQLDVLRAAAEKFNAAGLR